MKLTPLNAAFFLALSGCSLLSERPPSDHQPRVHDVPFQARENRDNSPRKRVLLLPFLEEPTARSGKAATMAREIVARELRASDDIVVISNRDLSSDAGKAPVSLLKNGDYDYDAITKVANAMGLAAVVSGRVIDVKARRSGDSVGLVRQVRAKIQATVQIKVYSAKSGKEILNESKTADVEDATTRIAERSDADRFLEDDPQLIDSVVTEAFRAAAPKVIQAINKISWEGRVALIKGERLFLNAGRLTGLQIGDILKVTDEGEDVFDPETGTMIGRVPGRLKGTIEVVSYFGKDGAVSIVHSGSGFKENDLIELY